MTNVNINGKIFSELVMSAKSNLDNIALKQKDPMVLGRGSRPPSNYLEPFFNNLLWYLVPT